MGGRKGGEDENKDGTNREQREINRGIGIGIGIGLLRGIGYQILRRKAVGGFLCLDTAAPAAHA